jgi:hypothetical protein
MVDHYAQSDASSSEDSDGSDRSHTGSGGESVAAKVDFVASEHGSVPTLPENNCLTK